MSKIDLTTPEWTNLVFEGKNKEYGAYVLRGESARRHNRSTLFIVILAVVGFAVPRLIKVLVPKHEEKIEVGPNTMANLKKAEVKQNQVKQIKTQAPPPALKTSVKFTPPVIKKDEEVKEENQMKSQEELNNTKGIISIADVKGNDDKNGKDIADIKAEVIEAPKEEAPLDVVEQMPSFPGGDGELFSYLSKNIKYPVVAQENGIQGTVYLRFAVSKTGDIDRVEVIRSLDSSCDKEAIRVVKSMPRWIPGRQNGANVAVWYTLPVKFRLE